MSKFAESHYISEIKDLSISTLCKKACSWFLDKWKIWFFPEVSRAKIMTFWKCPKNTRPRIQNCQPIIRQIKSTLKKLPQNEEKRSQNRENLQKAIYVNFHKKNFLYPPKLFLSETLNFELPKNLLICYKGTLASLLLGATKTSHSCLLVLNLKQRISP